MIFPVKTPFTVTADMAKYEGLAFNHHPNLSYLQQKNIELSRFGNQICATISESNEYVHALANYCGFETSSDISSSALKLEEDVAVLHQGKLVSICFSFPSGFIPAEKLGKNFFDMHLPVAGGNVLRAAGEKVSKLISREGSSFRRYVWTITSLSGLSQHPDYIRPTAKEISDLYFRTETQTTVGVGNDICLFFVKVDMHPLSLLWQEKDKQEKILSSINSMSDAVLTYKNLRVIKEILNHA
jgi:hypothetical protein